MIRDVANVKIQMFRLFVFIFAKYDIIGDNTPAKEKKR
jgi:hypothetical protein